MGEFVAHDRGQHQSGSGGLQRTEPLTRQDDGGEQGPRGLGGQDERGPARAEVLLRPGLDVESQGRGEDSSDHDREPDGGTWKFQRP